MRAYGLCAAASAGADRARIEQRGARAPCPRPAATPTSATPTVLHDRDPAGARHVSICWRWFTSCPAVMRTMCSIVSCPRSECIPYCFHCSGVKDSSKPRLASRNTRKCSTDLPRIARVVVSAGHPRILIVGRDGSPRCAQNQPQAVADHDLRVDKVRHDFAGRPLVGGRALAQPGRRHALDQPLEFLCRPGLNGQRLHSFHVGCDPLNVLARGFVHGVSSPDSFDRVPVGRRQGNPIGGAHADLRQKSVEIAAPRSFPYRGPRASASECAPTRAKRAPLPRRAARRPPSPIVVAGKSSIG